MYGKWPRAACNIVHCCNIAMYRYIVTALLGEVDVFISELLSLRDLSRAILTQFMTLLWDPMIFHLPSSQLHLQSK